MASADPRELTKVLRQWQVSRKACDLVSLNDHRSIVTSRVRIKNAFKERLGERPCQSDPTTNMPIDGLSPGKDNEGPDFVPRKIHQGPHQNVGGFRFDNSRSLFAQAP